MSISITHITPKIASLHPLVIYLSQPNRYDTACGHLLAGPPGDFLRSTIRDLGTDPDTCIYTLNHKYVHAGPHNTVLLGNLAARQLSPHYDMSIHDMRGSICTNFHGGELMSTFDPVECTDVISHEPESFVIDEDDSADPGSTYKDTSPTQRPNYRFWFKTDLEKLLKRTRRKSYKYDTIRNLNTSKVVEWLNSKVGTHLFFDIESHPATESLQCFTIADVSGAAVVVPVYEWYSGTRHSLPSLFAALARAFQRNTIVGHNIMFDLGFLFHYHGVPFGSALYDTMLVHHRCFPEVEKSLAHTMSFWGNFPMHKGEAGTFHPHNTAQFETLLEYNARDVLVLREIFLEQHKWFNKDSGLKASVQEVNDAIYPYLCASLTGFNIDTRTLFSKQGALKATLADLLRAIECLVGWKGFNPGSGKQLAVWLYNGGLSYPVLEKTDTGAPSTDMKTLYRLTVKYPLNIALRLVIMYKELDKTRGMLGFEPYFLNERR